MIPGAPGSLAQLDRLSNTRIWLCIAPTDMRRGFDRLAEQGQAITRQDPQSGSRRAGIRLPLARRRSAEGAVLGCGWLLHLVQVPARREKKARSSCPSWRRSKNRSNCGAASWP